MRALLDAPHYHRLLCVGVLLLCLPDQALAHGSYTSQIAALTEAIAAAPDSSDLYLRRGELHQLEQHWDSALHDYRRAAQLEPQHPSLPLCLASLHLETKQPAAAIRELLKWPESGEGAEYWFLRSRAHSDLGQLTSAIDCLDRALALSHDPRPDQFFDRVDLILARDPRDLAAAVDGLEAGLAKLGPVPSLGLRAMELEMQLGANDAALARLESMAEWIGRPELVLARRGDILEAVGRRLESQTAFTEALELIEALPPRRRNASATQELELRVRRSLTSAASVEPEE